MTIIDQIDDITGYIYVIEFESTDIDTNESELLGNKLPSFLFQPLLLGYT